jgi:hypothetical protein
VKCAPQLGIQRPHRVAFGRSVRKKKKRLTIFLAAQTVRPEGADPSKAKQSKLSFARASKEQFLEQNRRSAPQRLPQV